MNKKTALTTAITLGLSLLTTGAAQATPASWETSDKGLGTFNDLSGIFKRSAGQFTSSGGGWKNQWAYEPQTFNEDGSISSAPGAESFIRWGDPANWPPSSYEKFERSDDGEWILLDGFGDSSTGQFLKQRVTREVISDINCVDNRKELPLAEPEMIDGQLVGKQHYVKWQIQPVAYCLEAWGFIEIPGGENVNFYHRQAWFPPSGPTCSNPYMSGQVCVKQFEVWEDDNPANVPNSYGPGSQPGLNLIHRRDNILAMGKGHSFIHTNYLANNWTAFGSAYWTWS